ncbi:Hypothetical predicted protein, partial [Pelobates cultripes]
MHGERPRHIAAADIKHNASRASNGGRARPTYGRAQNRPRPQHATRGRKEAQPPSGRYRTEGIPGWGLTPGSVCGTGPPPPLAGGGYPGHIAATRATMGAPTWSARLPPTLAKAVEGPASQQKRTQTQRGKEST